MRDAVQKDLWREAYSDYNFKRRTDWVSRSFILDTFGLGLLSISYLPKVVDPSHTAAVHMTHLPSCMSAPAGWGRLSGISSGCENSRLCLAMLIGHSKSNGKSFKI